MCALVVYDAWLTQAALVEGSASVPLEWDWDTVERLLRH
jgi:hypothetical protein